MTGKNLEKVTEKEYDEGSLREKGIAIATFLVIAGLIFSKITGFMRDLFVSVKFPADLRESYSMAFYVPDFIYNLLVGGSIQAAITPSLARSIQTNDEKSGLRSVSIFISFAALIVGVAVFVGIFLADYIYPMIYSDYMHTDDAAIVTIASNTAKTLLPQVFFMMLAAFSIGILNAYKKFTATAFGPTVYNLFVLLSILLFAGDSATALYRTTVGITGAALVYFLFQVSVGKKYLRHFGFSLQFKDKGFRQLFRLAIPILISSSIIQLNAIILSSFAHNFSDNGIQFGLRNAFTLWQLPYGIFAVAVGGVMLPTLAGHFAAKDYARAGSFLSSSLRNALFMTIPMAGIIIMIPRDIVSVAFQWNENYTDQNVEIAAYLLLGYSAAVIIHTIVFIFNQAFYAIGKTRVPLISGIISTTVISVVCVFLISMQNNPRPIYLTLAYSLAGLFSAIFLVIYYLKDHRVRPSGMVRFCWKVSICFLALLISIWLINMVPFPKEGKLLQVAWLGIRGVIGLTAYFFTATLLQMNEWKNFIQKVKNRIGRRANRG
jgi:putative peptidoglycan lipid II flippase